ncbi:MAG: PA0069 family radical SAM protein [Burkholderiales bacterium]|nr:PA0069 family radical SAM protein [Burkholderiales bacterium]
MPAPYAVHRVPVAAIKGRGAATALAHRFSTEARTAFDDGWPPSDGETGESRPPPTQIFFETVKSVISRNDSPDIAFELSINPYRGCEHGCSYCYARPTHSYLNLSPGLDFETQIIAKQNIVEVLRAELGAPRYRPALLNIGSVTDAYQPVERELGLTRGVIGVLQACRHPFSLITKGSGVERDLDLIAPMAAQGLAAVYITITTLDAALARRMEPRAASPARRLRTLATLAQAGVPVGVSVAPQIPFINDDMEQVLEAAWAAGARSAFYTVLRLPFELAPLFREWLALHYPGRAARVMARVQEMRGGQDYQADFATRMKGQGLWADLIRQRFEKTCARLGYHRQRVALDLSRFDAARLYGQGSLFGDA